MLIVAQKNFDALNTTSDLIKNAVATIASNLPHDISECPLCLHHYNDNKELHEKIELAVGRMNPLIAQAVATIDTQKTEVLRLENIQQNATGELSKINQKSESYEKKIADLRRLLMSEFTNKILNATTPDEAAERQHSFLAEINKMEENLLLLSKQAEEVGPEIGLKSLQKEIDDNDSRLQALVRRIDEVQSDIKQKEAEKSSVEKNIKTYDVVQDVIKLISEAEVHINDLRIKLESLKRAQENQQRIIGQANDVLINDEETLNNIRVSISESHSRWTSKGFAGEPNLDDLEKKTNEEGSFIEILNKNIIQLDGVQGELLKWQAYEKQFTVEKELKIIRGEIAEDLFQKKIDDNIKHLTKDLEEQEKNQNALVTLFSNVDTQLKKINEQINSINPLWTKLLKRIVLDPRFAGTSLKTHIKNKKQRADVTVGLHNQKFLASQIASEAQITDLQFTFLLAMAQTYQWCPWKALLLDDPTQHHDLVHASAVFDLLRDYIAEQDFQVLLATHDSVHANFFVRKLQNDGIPTRIYRLKPEKDGVRAFQV